jgi:CubicO group peptidase (beta-lactamase class C family)
MGRLSTDETGSAKVSSEEWLLMPDLRPTVDPGDVGMDARRLARLESHFRSYVDDERLPGWLIAVGRAGKVAYTKACGFRDRGRGLPVETDTIWRLASMTKPVTSVAALMLYEEGAFELTDPVARFIPSFEGMEVYRAGGRPSALSRPATEPMRIWHLMTHTSGLTWWGQHRHPVDAMYRSAGFEQGYPASMNLASCCDVWASLPLLFEPGTEWNYSVSTAVLGRVVEVASGMALDQFFQQRIFKPLGMRDTAFWATEDAAPRLATAYAVNPAGHNAPAVAVNGDAALQRPSALSGGGGLCGTAGDYWRFAEMLRSRGNADDTRLLSPQTVDYMTKNHLPGGADLESFSHGLSYEDMTTFTTFGGIGFGLGMSVVIDPAPGKVLSRVGEYGWGGAYSTIFLVSPQEDLTAMFFTQLLPGSAHPIRSQLKQLVYQSLVD